MHVLSMRFHDDQWAEIRAEARRLEIPYSEFMRGAIAFYLGHQAGVSGRGEVEARVDALGMRVDRVAGTLTQVVGHLRGQRRADAL